MQGSGRKTNSSSSAPAGLLDDELLGLNFAASPPSAGYAVFATTPSFNVFRQNLSKSTPGVAAFNRSRMASYAVTPGLSLKAASTSCAERVLYSGAIKG